MIRLRTIALGVLAAAASFPALAGTASFSTGANYSSGKYGTSTTTDIWTVPFVYGYDSGRWRFKLTVPYISITGTGNVVPGVGRVLRHKLSGGGTSSVTTTASGLGDVVARLGYTLYYDPVERSGVDLGTRIKFGTANANKGLGTGRNDYGLALDAYKGLGRWTVFGGAGYTLYGSSPEYPLHNGANANVGFGYNVNSLGAEYYYRQRIADVGYQRSELSGFWNHRLGDKTRLQTYLLTGLSKGSPDWGGGASLKWSF